MHRPLMFVAAALGLLGVVAGTYHAHGLDRIVTDPKLMDSFEVGVKYQMYHALAIGLASLAAAAAPVNSALFRLAGWCFLAGIVLFSGSLYMLAVTDLRWLGMAAPVGGLALIVGWLAMAVAAVNRTDLMR